MTGARPPRSAARGPAALLRRVIRPETIRRDAVAGLVLGIESVPDGLAAGVLAGVNPIAGLYAYLFGMAAAALVTSSGLLAVQATGAMALVVSDAPLAATPDPEAALFTLSLLTGAVMIVAGLAGAGRVLRFVPTAVMTGFISAIGVNIVLGQLENLTGHAGTGPNRVVRAATLLLSPGQFHLPTVLVGVLTIAGVVLLSRTRLGSLGMVVAIVAGSVVAVLLPAWGGRPVALVHDVVELPQSLPGLTLPSIADVPLLLASAVSLAFIGIIQGAAVAAAYPNPSGAPSSPNRDFVGQGVGNLVSGLFQGMPVGGSMSATAINAAAGAATRRSLLVAGAVMAVIIVALPGVVGFIAMPALAGLLIVVGVQTVNPTRIQSVWKTGWLQTAVMACTFVLTLLIPIQYAVLAGVALGLLLYVVEASNRLLVRQLRGDPAGRMRETDPDSVLQPGAVVILQPYGSMFFGSAPALEQQLPTVGADSGRAVVILRLRGIDQIGLSQAETLTRYAAALAVAGSLLKVVVSSDAVAAELRSPHLRERISPEDVYPSTPWRREALQRAVADAEAWIAGR